MTAYYNEIDPLKAEVLREAIKVGAIAPGDVDERSIANVRPGDIAGYTQCHFFAGGGFWSLALRYAGWPDDRPVWTGSCPCPSFSAAGKGAGFNDPRHLWPHWFRLIAECRPPVLFGEQVGAAIGHGWFDLVHTDLEAQDYAVGAAVLGACSVGAPHIRQRLFFCADTECLRRGGRRFDHGGNAQSGGDEETERSKLREPATAHNDAGLCAESLRESGEWRTGGVSGSKAQGGSERFADGDMPLRFEHGDEAGLCADAESRRQQQFPHSGREGAGPFGETAESRERLQPTGGYGPGAMPGDGAGFGSEGHSQLKGQRNQSEGFTPDDGALRERRRPGWLNPDAARSASEAGATRGFWADCDWWHGRDGKYRPIGPGLFPLAHGSPARVGRLRMYGDGIVVQAAQAFIESYLETKETS